MEFELDGSNSTEPMIVMSHRLDAPRELVWAAFTDPRHVVNWYGGYGFTNTVLEMDVRPGGRWRHVMRKPDGSEYHLSFVYVEVTRPERLSWQDADHGKAAAGHPTALNSITFEDHGSWTRVSFVARFDSLASRDMAMRFGFAEVMREGVARANAELAGMQSPLRTLAIETFAPMLGTLAGWLEKGAEHARAHGREADALVGERLAPDMFTLAQQVSTACFHAVNGVALVTGAPARPVAAAGTTLAELAAQIAAAVAELRAVPDAAFAGSEARRIELPLQGDLVLDVNGLELMRDWCLPHFYFHAVTAYDILRHQGVQLGKRDFLAHIGRSIRRRGA
ncbi:MAG: DUF1993 family protein [Myxococcota bacterium]